MSYGNAISLREEMIREYKRMLASETDTTRIDDINKQINLCLDEIAQLKNGKPLFGKPTRLAQETRIITADPETKSQKIVVINPHPPVAPSSPKEPKRLENSLRAKIQAAKAAKKGN